MKVVEPSSVQADIDFTRPGKQYGAIRIPRSTNTSGWANIVIPVVSIRNGEGPVALVLGGNHGDEYEGQIAILNLANTLESNDVHGGLILLPCLSMESSYQGTRLWPDGSNLNRSFPGSPSGKPNEQLADYLTRALFPQVDIVIDLHSGGMRSLRWYPMSHMHLVDDPDQRQSMLEGMLAWNTDYHMLYIDVAGKGLLPSEAERQGKIVVTTELGSGSTVLAATHRLTRAGLENVLKHFKILDGPSQSREDLGLPEARILSATDPSAYVFAPESGHYETLVDAGDRVQEGDLIGRLWDLERPDRPPTEVLARRSGIVCAARAMPVVDQGDCVAVIGQEIDRSNLS